MSAWDGLRFPQIQGSPTAALNVVEMLKRRLVEVVCIPHAKALTSHKSINHP